MSCFHLHYISESVCVQCTCTHVCVVCVLLCAPLALSRQAADRPFLEELLRYLRQQRRQLDESWTLIENMEQQKQKEGGGASRVAVETSQSGTIPSSSAAGRERGKRKEKGGGRQGTSGVDLSALYEHSMSPLSSLSYTYMYIISISLSLGQLFSLCMSLFPPPLSLPSLPPPSLLPPSPPHIFPLPPSVVLKTQASLIEAKSNLSSHQKHT